MQKSNSFKNLKPVIAIDGTAGSGKGTLAKKLANFIKFDHLDTGILYRICALEMLERKIELNNVDIYSLKQKRKSNIKVIEIGFSYDKLFKNFFLNENDLQFSYINFKDFD